jgi:hypothetical protein
MRPNKEKKEKPLKKIKTIKKQKEEEEQALKPAVRIQELKNKLIILAHELKVDKKINDTLYRKMQLLTYSRTTEQKLKDSYKTLKDINNKIDYQKNETNQKIKKITVKDFEANKKNVDDDKNVLYNVYIKYKVWFNISEPTEEKDNYEVFTDNEGIKKHTIWEIKNSTLHIYGKNTIIEEMKNFIDTVIYNAYTHKIKILDVHVNKEVYQPKQYRYLGAAKKGSYYIVGGSSGYNIKYFKAWNATFNYKGFNLDMNNDIEFECVPNALFKTYGTKKETSNQYLHSVHKGGLDYVKKVLNRNNTTQDETPINYINPYDKMIENAEKMIKEYINQYEYSIDYEFDVESVDDIKDEKIKNEIESLYKSIDEYTEQKTIIDNKFNVQNKKGKKGYTSDDILCFCNEHKIKCFGYDWKMQQFITNKNEPINFNKNIPAFVFYFNDSHIYLINDTSMRKSLLHSHDKSDIISLISKEASKNKNERDIKVDIPFEEWGNGENINIYITGQRVVNNTFYKLICDGEVYNNGIKLCEKDGIIKFTYLNNNKIIYNPDYYMVNKTIENLNNRNIDIIYKFENQKMSTLAMDFLKKEFCNLPLSIMNESGDYIFNCDYIRNCQFNGWFNEPKSKDLNAYDYNKHYTSCLMGKGCSFGWPVYSIFDEVKPFDGEIETGFYYINTNNFFPFKGAGWYDADLVYYACECKIITNDNILLQYKSSDILNTDNFKTFIDEVYKLFDNPKYAINTLIGIFGHNYKSRNVHHFTQDSRLVLCELEQNKDAKVKYIYKSEFMNDNKDDKCIDMDNFNPDDHIKTESPLIFHVYNNKRVKSFQNYLPFFYKIYNVSAMKMHQMATKIGGIVRGVFTDTIIFEGNINKPKCNKDIIGGIRETAIKDFTKCINTTPRASKYIDECPKPIKLKQIKEFKLDNDKGCFITGEPGTGKTYMCKQLQQEILNSVRNGGSYKVCTPTHKSALIANATTIFNLFNINPIDYTYLKSTVENLKKDGVEWIFIDEVSMITSKIWSAIRDIKTIYGFKFVLFGDFYQLPSVESKHYDVVNSEVFSEICDGQMLELTRNYRAENDVDFKEFITDLRIVKKGGKPDFKTYGTTECRKSLCWTNKTRKAINYKWMQEESRGVDYVIVNNFKVFVGLPVICKTTMSLKRTNKVDELSVDWNQELKNNEEFEVIDIKNKKILIKK